MGCVDGREARSITLPATLASVSASRRFVQDVVSEVADAPVADVLLMTSELVANVVRHTDSEITVTVRDGPPVRVEVHDGVAATEAFRALVSEAAAMPEVGSIGGRGLAIVRTLAHRVGLDDDPGGGKVVWFEC
jgi:anti-sigma regulatory factor (Ser/Thr protein kinase)